jgi:hypothetical protein
MFETGVTEIVKKWKKELSHSGVTKERNEGDKKQEKISEK